MLRISNVSKWYGPDPVLLDVSFVLSPRQSFGLVGPNGSGKSTLLRLASGELSPDTGSVWIDPGSSIGYLPQYPLDEFDLSIHEALMRGAGRVGEIEQRLRSLESALQETSGDTLDSLLAEYAVLQEEFERLEGYSLEARLESVMQGLGMDARVMNNRVGTLSGGNKTKLSLARLLLSSADILLLDEPTNYLDLPALLWLERFVTEGQRSYIIVSHDRRFLDRTVSGILEIDPESHTVREWFGTYSQYAEAKRVEQEKRLAAYHLQQEKVERVEQDIRRTREQARGVERTARSGMGADVQRRLAKKVAKKAKARERRLERELERDTIDKPRRGWGLHLANLGGETIDDRKLVLEVEDLRAGYADHPVLRGVDLLLRGEDRVALLGENGSGKSTLLRCLSGTLPYTGRVRIGPGVRPGVLTQEAEELPLDRIVLDVFGAGTEMHESEARTYLHKFLFQGSEPLKLVRELSYGQRAKLALAVLVLSDANFLILDEPTSHMDMPALEAIEQALAEYEGPMLVVSHDRYFLERIGINRVLVMENGDLREVENVAAYEAELARP